MKDVRPVSEDLKSYELEELFDPRNPMPRLLHVGERGFRQLCAHSVERFPHIKPLKTFDLVGATIFDLDLERDPGYEPLRYGPGFHDRVEYSDLATDTDRFRQLVTYLIRSGIPVSPDFTVNAPNLLNGDDYLAGEAQADVVLLSNLVSLYYDDLVNPAEEYQRDYNRMHDYKLEDTEDAAQNERRAQYRAAMAAKDYPNAWIHARYLGGVCSPLSTPENWARRLLAANPEIIVAWRAVDSLPIHLTGHNSMSQVLPKRDISDPFLKAVAAEIAQRERTFFSVEIAMSEPFLESALPNLSHDTLLALRLRHDRTGGTLPDLRGFDGDGYFGDGTRWHPHAPYRTPIDNPLSDMDYLDAFWSLAADRDNPPYRENMLLPHRITPELRAELLTHIDHFEGRRSDARFPIAFNY